jgi:hypothetical protein
MRRLSVLVLASVCGLAVGSAATAARAQTAKLNTIEDVGRALSACWAPPPPEKSRPGTEITVLITFNRNGEVMGEPRFTFITRGIPQEMRAAYQLSVADAISRCVPLSFTPGLAGAIAGRPFAMRYHDYRGEKGA